MEVNRLIAANRKIMRGFIFLRLITIDVATIASQLQLLLSCLDFGHLLNTFPHHCPLYCSVDVCMVDVSLVDLTN